MCENIYVYIQGQNKMNADLMSITKQNLLESWAYKQVRTQMFVFPCPMPLVYWYRQAPSSTAKCCISFYHFPFENSLALAASVSCAKWFRNKFKSHMTNIFNTTVRIGGLKWDSFLYIGLLVRHNIWYEKNVTIFRRTHRQTSGMLLYIGLLIYFT